MDLKRKGRGLFMPRWAEESDSLDDTANHNTTVSASPSGFAADRRSFSFQSIRHRATRSLGSREAFVRSETYVDLSAARLQGRRLSKTRRTSSSASFEVLNRRMSGFSEDSGGVSRTSTTLSTSSSSTVDWKTQTVEGVAALEPDSQLLRTKSPYLVVTTDFIVKARCQTDVLSLFPQLAQDASSGGAAAGSSSEPLLTIPVASIVSVFPAESTRPSFGIEVWWRPPLSLSFHHTTFFFTLPTERTDQLKNMIRAMATGNHALSDFDRQPSGLLEPLTKIHAAEEPNYQHQKLEIFPVVTRGHTRTERAKLDETHKKPLESPSSYLVVGANLCFFVEAQRAPGRRGEVICKHRTFGLVTLECLKGDWIPHQERFNITFRDPFKQPVTLELASRYYRHIIRVFGKADGFLKPAWPPMWRMLETFRIAGLKELQYLVPREDYGSVKRTLDSYIAAYHCAPVEWEVNWKTQFAPEFRLRRPNNGSTYSPLQLLAVLRALRYNDYFSSLSFRDIDLSVLWNYYDNSAKGPNSAYLNRSYVALSSDEVDLLRMSPVLHQEFHALAFCSGTIRQIDFTNTFSTLPTDRKVSASHSVQFLTPILNLLQSGLTKCNRLILSGNALTPTDLQELAETLQTGTIQGLDISHCGLKDIDLRGLLEAISCRPHSLQSLNISNNTGRFPARIVPGLVALLANIRQLNLCGSLREEANGPLVPFESLERLPFLEELDISKSKLNQATLLDLERFLHNRSLQMGQGQASKFCRLALNNCGITGEQAARLFEAIGENKGVHLSVNGNPLEEGIETLARSIWNNQGPVGLSMEMIEFKNENNYSLLINALTETEHLGVLSLVGTAPTPSADEPIEPETTQALEHFFARNRSIRHLDFSGFCGKLDDGQLAKGFGHSLIGLVKNTTMTHLRIRNQNLHDDAGTLGTVIAENRSLRMFDCQDNNLNLTSLQFLVSSLKENRTILEFPFAPDERDRIWIEVLRGLRRQSLPVALTPKTASSAGAAKTPAKDPKEALLRDVFRSKFAELDGYLRRNRTALEEETGQLLDLESPTDSGGEEGWPGLDPRATSPTGTAMMHGAADGADGLVSAVAGDGGENGNDATPPVRPADADQDTPTEQPTQLQLPQRTIRSSSMTIDTSIPAPYHVPGHDSGSPTDTPDPASAISTPPELVNPPTPEDLAFQKMIEDFKKAGFESS